MIDLKLHLHCNVMCNLCNVFPGEVKHFYLCIRSSFLLTNFIFNAIKMGIKSDNWTTTAFEGQA